MDYFEVFGLPRILGLDLRALEKTFHELSRKYHPDYFSRAPAAEKTPNPVADASTSIHPLKF